MRRCIFFAFYDKDGIVDRYILTILKDLRRCSERIVFVANGKLSAEGRKAVQEYSDDILVRANSGLDIWAHKETMSYLGWNVIGDYDELVLMNSTFFPALHSFSDMFDDMERICTDFWGVSMYFKGRSFIGPLPDHIQSFFIAVRHPMLCSYEFKLYWENLPPMYSYEDAVGLHESRFTETFQNYGFQSYVYAGAEELRPLVSYPSLAQPLYLLEQTNAPLLKRKVFIRKYNIYMHQSAGESAVDAYRFLKNSDGYDTEAIWENILRTACLTDIKNALQLNYILPSQRVLSDTAAHPKIGVILFLYSCKFTDRFARYFASIPMDADIHILSPLGDVSPVQELLPGRQITLHQTEPGQLASVSVMDFLSQNELEADYILVLQWDILNIAGYSAMYKSLECLLRTPELVRNIFGKFEEEPRLGLLFPSPPDNESYIAGMGREWIAFKKDVIALANQLGIAIDPEESPIAPYLGAYWCRMETLRGIAGLYAQIAEKRYGNQRRGTFEFWNIVLSLLAQKNGYYSAWGFSEEFAAIEITNTRYYLNKLLSSLPPESKDNIWQIADKLKNNYKRM